MDWMWGNSTKVAREPRRVRDARRFHAKNPSFLSPEGWIARKSQRGGRQFPRGPPPPFRALAHHGFLDDGVYPLAPGSGRYRVGRESRWASSGNARSSRPRRLREVVVNNTTLRSEPRRTRSSVLSRRRTLSGYERRGRSVFSPRSRMPRT